MTTLRNHHQKPDAAKPRQRAGSISSNKNRELTAELLLTNRKPQSRDDRQCDPVVTHRRNRQPKTSRQHPDRPLNRHTAGAVQNGSHHLRGFLPWGLSVASR
jgi:hypothetical protein